MRRIKACLFDLDGVICDTAKYHYLAWKAIGDELGITFTETDNERLKGISRMESLDILLSLGEKEYTQEEKEVLAHRKNEIYKEYIAKMTEDEILPGVLDLLRYLKKENIKIALGSVSKNAYTILTRLHLKEYFDNIVDGTCVKNAKPDPEVFLLGAKGVGVKPEECVVFEDSQAGLIAAKAGNMLAVGIGSPEILTKADIHIYTFADVEPKELLKNLQSIEKI